MNLEREEQRDQVIPGIVGAFLGSLVGAACIILVDRLGYAAALCGAMMAVCSLRGYALLGGRLSKRGAVISSLIILVMTYVSHRICFALLVLDALPDGEEVGFFEVYRSLEAFWQGEAFRGAYFGGLALLYLCTLIGAVPVMIRTLQKPETPPRSRRASCRNEEAEEDFAGLQGQFYPFRKDWMRPLRLSVLCPLQIVVATAIAGFLITRFAPESRWAAAAALGCSASTVLLFFRAIPTFRLCNAAYILYVRAGGRLWRVDLRRFCGVQDWERESSRSQKAIQWDILCEIQCRLEGEAPGYGCGALAELRNPQVERETRWSWMVSYETETGARKKLKIGKGHPGFSPASGWERSQEPAPCRWTTVVFSFVLTALMMGGCWAANLRPELVTSGAALRTPESETEESVPIAARTPESVTQFEMSEIWFEMDSAFQYGRRQFVDPQTGTFYRAYTQYGVDEEDAWDTLSQYIEAYHTSSFYDHFEMAYGGEDRLAPLDEMTRYNIVSVYLSGGWAVHTAAVLSDSGALFTMEAEHDMAVQSAEEVLANLMYTLRSTRFEGPAVTAENYRSQMHVSKIRGCEYMAVAYIKTDLFGHDAFVDVYVPYSDTPIYSADGMAVRSEAHGLRVYAAILPGENAKQVVEARQRTLISTGQVYEDEVDDQMYREDLDAACKLTVYEENGQKRFAVLYADSKWEGFYLLREITGLPELVDEEYPALLTELEKIMGLTMPVLENL